MVSASGSAGVHRGQWLGGGTVCGGTVLQLAQLFPQELAIIEESAYLFPVRELSF
jgi:hypothetical protein